MKSASRDLCKRLVVISNRLPYKLAPESSGKPPKRNVGGLVNAVEPVLAEIGGCWIGWDGALLPSSAGVSAALARPQIFRSPTGIELHGVPLSEREVSRYYHGFSNRALWPLFHGFTDKAVFAAEDYSSYLRVNRRFAEVTLARAGADGRIWVHDYQLMLMPMFLREMGFRGRVDFFLHIPFPPSEIFRALPWREEILDGLLAADTVAFHVDQYRDNFITCCTKLADTPPEGATLEGGVLLQGGRTTAVTNPIGIDVDDFVRIAASPEVEARARRIREVHRGARILFGADRLDYTKGIQERLKAMERLFVRYPELCGRVVLIQVVVPSRHQVEAYRTMKREIDREVGRINGEFGREGWVPIHYRYLALDRKELVAHYRAADAALITPLRDGMNLVAPEFAASRVDEDGVLLLSEMAGVAERSPGAVLVNPYDIDGTARAISAALEMSREERRRRMIDLRAQVRANPASRWAERCLGFDPHEIPAALSPEPRGAVASKSVSADS